MRRNASFADLSRDGPVVIESPAGAYGVIDDYWQRPIVDIGPFGPEKGQGGTFLVLPADDRERVPKGYIAVRSATNRIMYLARGLVKDGNIEAAVDTLSQIRMYPLKQAAHPPKTAIVRSGGKAMASIAPSGYAYWERLADIINNETVEQRDRFFHAMLKPLNIEKGKPFAPDARQKKILSDAATLDFRMAQALSMAPRLANASSYPGTHRQGLVRLFPLVWANRGFLRQELEARRHRPRRLRRSARTSAARALPVDRGIRAAEACGQGHEVRQAVAHGSDGEAAVHVERRREGAGRKQVTVHATQTEGEHVDEEAGATDGTGEAGISFQGPAGGSSARDLDGVRSIQRFGHVGPGVQRLAIVAVTIELLERLARQLELNRAAAAFDSQGLHLGCLAEALGICAVAQQKCALAQGDRLRGSAPVQRTLTS